MDTSFQNPSISFHPGVTLSEKLKETRMGVKEFAIKDIFLESIEYADKKIEKELEADAFVTKMLSDFPTTSLR